MSIHQISVPLTVRFNRAPVQGIASMCCPVNFTEWLGRLGLRGMVDASSLCLCWGRGKRENQQPAQFSPADDFDAVDNAAGELHWGEFHKFGRSKTLEVRQELRFTVTTDADAPRMPYPPHAYRHFEADGNAAPVAHAPHMILEPQPHHELQVKMRVGREDLLVTSYHYHPDQPKPYLWPLVYSNGINLVRLGHPHDPGDTHDHHHGVWVGHRGINGVNFWEEKTGGFLRHQNFERMEDGPVMARLRPRILWESPEGQPIAEERRQITTCVHGLDFDIKLTGVDGPLEFVQAPFGLLGVRVAKSMSVFDGGGRITNSEGGLNEPGVFGQPARWCDYTGPVAPDTRHGITFMDHPDNPNHPTQWHVRHDGWMGASFTGKAPFTLPAGETLRLRYRLHLHDANPERTDDELWRSAEAAWQDYVNPPEVDWGEPVASIPPV